MPHYIYKIQPVRLGMLTDKPTPAEDTILSEHFNYLRRLTEEGVVVLAGRTLTADENSFGVVIFEADNEFAAQQIKDNDPAVRFGVMNAELYPYRISLIRKE